MEKEFWIFIDGGAKPKDSGGFHGSYAYSIHEVNDKGELVEIKKGGNYFKSTTAPRMELMSLGHALTFLNSYIDMNKIESGEVNIVADAMNTVKTMKVWIFNWIRNIKDGVLRKKHFKTKKWEPVLNQDIIVASHNLIVALGSGFRVNFLHINSHIDKDKIPEAHIKFQEFNNMLISLEDFKVLVEKNEEVDKIVNEIHNKGAAQIEGEN